MKQLIVLIAVVMTVFALAGCDDRSQLPSVIKNVPINPTPTEGRVILDKSNTITVGNSSWLAINMMAEVSDHAPLILGIVNTFEETHPELVILNWVVENKHRTHAYSPQIYGIWVHHRPKTAAELEAPPQ